MNGLDSLRQVTNRTNRDAESVAEILLVGSGAQQLEFSRHTLGNLLQKLRLMGERLCFERPHPEEQLKNEGLRLTRQVCRARHVKDVEELGVADSLLTHEITVSGARS